MDIHWKDIVNKLNFKVSHKLARDTVLAFYTAFESSIDVDCNIRIRNIGKFKGTPAGIRKKSAIKNDRHNKSKIKHKNKMIKRRQRLWAKEQIDKYWPE